MSHDLSPSGTWHPGMGSSAADRGYAGPRGGDSGRPNWQTTFAGELRPRGNSQSADPVIKDKANRKNVSAKPNSQRSGPAGVVSCGRAYAENQSHTDTGRNVRLLPSAHGNADFRRSAKGGG